MLTILFDGIAYGMLLFVLACGLAVTLGLMNFVNLAHGAFAMAGGYVTVVLMNRYGVPFLADASRSPFSFRPSLGLVLERTLYVATLRAQPSRPGAVLDRPRLHGGRGGRLPHGLAAADHPAAAWLQGRVDVLGIGSASTALHHRRLRRARRRAAAASWRGPASAAGCARRSTIRASRAASASTST